MAFYFRKFTDAEFNYEIHDKKLLAIIVIFKKLKKFNNDLQRL